MFAHVRINKIARVLPLCLSHTGEKTGKQKQKKFSTFASSCGDQLIAQRSDILKLWATALNCKATAGLQTIEVEPVITLRQIGEDLIIIVLWFRLTRCCNQAQISETSLFRIVDYLLYSGYIPVDEHLCQVVVKLPSCRNNIIVYDSFTRSVMFLLDLLDTYHMSLYEYYKQIARNCQPNPIHLQTPSRLTICYCHFIAILMQS